MEKLLSTDINMEKLLSTDILENIFSRLPIEVGLQAKRVCKTWKDILQNYKSGKMGFVFVFSHEDNFDGHRGGVQQLSYGEEYDHYDRENLMNYYCSHDTLTKIKHGRFTTDYVRRDIMVGSCNGLVCFGRYINYAWSAVPYLICNPFTGESVVLPEYNYSKFTLDISATNRCTLASGFGYCPLTNKYKVVTIYYHEKEREGHVQVYTVGSGEWRYIGRSSS
ncbi:uncharacterized protein LOC113311457 [Papaver somniferum]|uniref:uncharacterized protein LOC113311457 n=1 Tax=Papaver somniferum TaxID=3469 RepID=UPI000E6FD89A|nr:uncharacterized protein LOC113311457 [Papaver somniferum]